MLAVGATLRTTTLDIRNIAATIMNDPSKVSESKNLRPLAGGRDLKLITPVGLPTSRGELFYADFGMSSMSISRSVSRIARCWAALRSSSCT